MAAGVTWLLADTDGLHEFPTARAALDHWADHPTAFITIVPPDTFDILDDPAAVMAAVEDR